MNNVKFKLDTTNFPKKVNVNMNTRTKLFDKCMNKKGNVNSWSYLGVIEVCCIHICKFRSFLYCSVESIWRYYGLHFVPVGT